jgi:hypothetical protein
MTQVDRDMRMHVVWGTIIEHQTEIMNDYLLNGSRITPTYELQEGSPGGDSTCQNERIVMNFLTANEKIIKGTHYRAHMETIVRQAAQGDADRETFIRRYWWAGDSTLVKIRSQLVLDALPFLAHSTWRTGRPGSPNRTFYRWQSEIYQTLGELMGYWEPTASVYTTDSASRLLRCN